MDLIGRDFLTLLDFTPAEIGSLLDLAAELKAKKKAGIPHDTLRGKNVACFAGAARQSGWKNKASYWGSPKDSGANAMAVRPSCSTPVLVISPILRTAKPGSRLRWAAVLQGISRSCAPAGGSVLSPPANQPAKNCRTSGGRREPASVRLTTSTGIQVMGSVRWQPVSSMARR